MGSAPPRFCPFCRECFEDTAVCPDHELPLVDFDALPRTSTLPRDDERLPFYDPRFGRGLLWLASILTLVGFSLPLVTTSAGQPLTSTGFEVASRVAPYLWAVPLVGAAWMSVLGRRRTPRGMRGARAAVPLLALLAGTSVYYAIHRIREGAAQAAAQTNQEVTVELEVGVWVIAAALLVGLAAGFRLGVLPRREALPHGGALDEHARSAIVMDEEDEDDL